MKYFFLTALCAVTLCAGMSSCKKGENDPFLSMRTRKARIAGEWKLSNLAGTDKDVNPGISTTHTTVTSYDGTTKTQVDSYQTANSSTSSTSTNAYSVTLTIKKDGTYQQTLTENGATSTTEGTWIFLRKSKKNDLKSKEAVMLTETSTSSGGTTTTSSDLDGMVYTIDELKNKEMILKYEWSQSSGGNTLSSDQTLTFTNN